MWKAISIIIQGKCYQLLLMGAMMWAQDPAGLHRAGVVELEQGRFESAERLLRHALVVGERNGDSSSLLTMLELARALLMQEKFTESERMVLRALRRIDQPDPAVQRGAVAALQILTTLYWAAGRHREAESVGQRAFSMAGADHPESAVILATIGLIKKESGQLSAAVSYFEKALSILRRPADLPALLYMFGQLRFQQKKWDEAAQLYQRALSAESSDRLLIANLKSALGAVQVKRGLLEEAYRLSSEAVVMGNEVYPKGHRSSAAILHEHAQVLRALGRKQEAKAMEAQAKDIHQSTAPDRVLPPRVDVRALSSAGR